MSSLMELIGPWLGTLVFFGAYSVYYKDNPLYRFVQSLVVGVGAGYLFSAQIMMFTRIIMPELLQPSDPLAQPAAALALVMGLAFFCIFIPRLTSIYRAASILVMTVGIGLVLPLGVAIIWTVTQSYAVNLFAGLGPIVTGICYVLGLSYFLFTEKVDKPTAPFRSLGRVVLLVYAAMCISMTGLGKLAMIQWKVLDAIWGYPPTWEIPVGIFILILIDAFVYRLRNLIPGAKAAEAETKTKPTRGKSE